MEAVGALGYKRTAIVVMKIVGLDKRSASGNWSGINPQLMRRATRARGLVAESNADSPTVDGEIEHVVRAGITDAAGDAVASVVVTWHLRP